MSLGLVMSMSAAYGRARGRDHRAMRGMRRAMVANYKTLKTCKPSYAGYGAFNKWTLLIRCQN